MKRIALICFALVLVSAVVYAAGSLQGASGIPVQGFAPDGRLTQTLAITSTTVDMSDNAAYGIYCPADAKLRTMPTSAKGNYVQSTIPGGSWLVRVTNSATPFVNISGCTSGHLQRQ